MIVVTFIRADRGGEHITRVIDAHILDDKPALQSLLSQMAEALGSPTAAGVTFTLDTRPLVPTGLPIDGVHFFATTDAT